MSNILATLLFLSCVYQALNSPLTQSKRNDEDAEMTDKHNDCRGKENAANMKKVSWDKDLAREAQECSDECEFKHCAASGENVYIASDGPTPTAEKVVGAWCSEKSHFSVSEMSCQHGKVCGHFTQVAWANTEKIGCAKTRCGELAVFADVWINATLVVCRYSPSGNVMGEDPYKKGTPCTECHNLEGCSNGLCDPANSN